MLDDHLEPAAMQAAVPEDVPVDAIPYVQAALSAAISLKRIADSLDGIRASAAIMARDQARWDGTGQHMGRPA